jgi:phenolic acid decarboxylase
VQNDIYDLIKEYNLRLEGYDPYGVRIFDDVTHTMGSGSTSNEVFENQISDSVKRQIEKLKQKR